MDAIEVAVIPILLGGGIPLLPPPTKRINLTLKAQKVYKTGIVSLNYAITWWCDGIAFPSRIECRFERPGGFHEIVSNCPGRHILHECGRFA